MKDNIKTPLVKIGVYNEDYVDILLSALNRQGYTTSFNEETYEITFGGPMMRIGFLEDEMEKSEKSEKSENNIN